ncbi:MAG TPA: hypothetical protein VGE74_20800 [Gemmata sp.]
MRYVVLLVATGLCGCFNDPKPAPTAFKSEPHGHSHESEHMLKEDAGHYHAALTAHLSQKDGNELDIFFETIDSPPKPHALPVAKFTATAKTASGQEYTLAFEPAPSGEREGDPEGRCSHFVAKAGWMKPEDVLTVTATVDIDGKPTPIAWKNFSPQKYAHHVE